MSSSTTEKDRGENWQRIAALAGFSEDVKTSGEQVNINIDTKTDSDESLLPPDEEIDHSDPTNRFSFSGNPNKRMVLAIGGAAAVVLLGLTALAFKDKKNAPKVVDSDSKKESTNSSSPPTNSDVGKLKTELAYLRQQQQIAQLNQQQPPPPPKSPQKTKKVVSSRRVAPPPPPRVVYRTMPTRQLRPIERSLPPPRIPSPAPPPIVRPVDPHQAYREATALGSYGQVVALSDSNEPDMATEPTTSSVYSEAIESQTNSSLSYKSMGDKIPLASKSRIHRSRVSSPSSIETDPTIEQYQEESSLQPTEPQGWQYAVSRQRFRPMSNPSRAIQNSESTYSDVSFDEPPSVGEAFDDELTSLPTDDLPSLHSDQSSYYEQELPILEERRLSVKQIPIDSKAEAQLLDSVVWDNQQIYSNDFLTIRLSEPLLDRNSEIIIPENSLLVVRAAPTPAGIVTLVAESFLVEQNGSLKEIPLEPNSVTIRTDDGDPLAAERVDLSESQSEGDVGGLLVDVIGTAAGMAIGGGDNAYRDLYRFNQLEQLYDRHEGNSRRDSFEEQRSNAVWKLEAGMSVEVYVSRPLTIRE
jgi:hypothetical protein